MKVIPETLPDEGDSLNQVTFLEAPSSGNVSGITFIR
jgi:hypothetical protein